VGGIPFERSAEKSSLTTREQEQESRLRNRGVNLTYREFLSESETLIAGTPLPRNFNAAQDKLPEISVEQRYASQLGVKLGDVMGFDIQGIPLQAKVTSLRRVKWTSFQPNFFIEFQPGVLEEAPKTYIAAVDEVSKESRIQLQNQLVGLFPNVSVIDVSTVTQRVLQLFGQMSWALRVIAVFSVFTGMVVLFSIARYQAQSRKTEVQLLKLLGGTPRLINSTQWLEFGGLGLFAACSGVLLSQALSWSVSYFLFDSIWNFNPILPLVTVAGITSLTLIVTRFAVHNTLREKPASLLS
jgi:putative ABC transport system permease protein